MSTHRHVDCSIFRIWSSFLHRPAIKKMMHSVDVLVDFLRFNLGSDGHRSHHFSWASIFIFDSRHRWCLCLSSHLCFSLMRPHHAALVCYRTDCYSSHEKKKKNGSSILCIILRFRSRSNAAVNPPPSPPPCCTATTVTVWPVTITVDSSTAECHMSTNNWPSLHKMEQRPSVFQNDCSSGTKNVFVLCVNP